MTMALAPLKNRSQRSHCSLNTFYYVRPDTAILDGVSVWQPYPRLVDSVTMDSPVEADIVTGSYRVRKYRFALGYLL